MPTTAAAAPGTTRARWRRARVWVRRVAPYVVAGTFIVSILRENPPEKILEAFATGNSLPIVPIGIVMSIGVLFLVSLWDFLVFSGTLGRPRYLDVVRGKAGTSVMLTLGYGFGAGAYGVWLARSSNASARAASAATLLVVVSDLAAVSLVSSVSMWLVDAQAPLWLRILAPVLSAVALGLITLRLRRAPSGDGFVATWRTMPRKRALAQVAGRAFNITLGIVVTWAAARVFGLSIPLSAMAAYLPVLALVGALPINVAGFGAVQAAWVAAFSSFAPGPSVIAFQVLWFLGLGSGIVLRGLPFVKRVIAEIDEGAKPRASADGPELAAGS